MLAAIDSGDSDAVADALAAILAPPRLANTDGHDLVAHTITWRVPDPSLVGDALVAAGLQAEQRRLDVGAQLDEPGQHRHRRRSISTATN